MHIGTIVRLVVLVISFLIDSVLVLVKKNYSGSSTVPASVGTVDRLFNRSIGR